MFDPPRQLNFPRDYNRNAKLYGMRLNTQDYWITAAVVIYPAHKETAPGAKHQRPKL